MKISIVTVCFNSAATVVDTLASVAGQTHPDIEHIVIDGASRDDTVALVRRHGAHVAHLVSERDRGIYDAMNKGIALATGDFVGFLNADDLYASPESVARIAAAAKAGVEGQRCDAVYGDLVYVRAGNTDAVIRLWRSGEFLSSRLRFGWMPPHPTFYTRRELINSLGGFDTSLRIAADYDFMLRCLTKPGLTVSYVPEILVRMRAGGASNQSLGALWRKSSEDLQAMRRNGVGGISSLMFKNLRKVHQFFSRA